MWRCSVPSVISSDIATDLNVTFLTVKKWHARGPNLHALIYLFVVVFSIAGHFNHVHCTLCEEKKKMSQILVFNNAVQYLRSCKMYPLYRNLQHVVYQDWMGGTQ